MNSPIPLLTLCAAATKGPWQVYTEPQKSRESVGVELAQLCKGTPDFSGKLVMLSADNGICPAVTGCGKDSEANAELICRIASPEVAAKVYQALEELTTSMEVEIDLGTFDDRPNYKKDRIKEVTEALEALNLLDGKTT